MSCLRFEVNMDFAHLRRVPQEVAPAALAQGMEHIRGVASELTPIESGRLVGSATVHVEGDQASLTFDGPYARIQHEDLTFTHEHGQAKYLEQPMSTEARPALDIVARRIQEAL